MLKLICPLCIPVTLPSILGYRRVFLKGYPIFCFWAPENGKLNNPTLLVESQYEIINAFDLYVKLDL